MNIKITPKKLHGTVNAIASKSHAHRLMLAAALCTAPCKIHISDMNDDLLATQKCINALQNNSFRFDCKESGSTLRFMLPIAMALSGQASFFGEGRLPQRPLSPLKEEMEVHGCSFSSNNDTHHICTVTGKLHGGTFSLAGNVSSQYITGLLFALPLLEEDSFINITSKLESVGYVRLTLEVLELFGIRIEGSGDCSSFYIPGGQKYISPKEATAEGDWSNAAFWIVADALSKEKNELNVQDKFCLGLNSNSSQGDKEIISFVENEALTETKTLIFDVADVPDLVPILAVLATSRKGITHITNAARLRLKESDRLATVHEMIENLGGNISEEPEGLTIIGNGHLLGGTVNGHNDHRIVMAAAIASILCTEPVVILGVEAVNKSYPKFFEDFTALGGDFCEF